MRKCALFASALLGLSLPAQSAPPAYLPPERIGDRPWPACRALADDCPCLGSLEGDDMAGHPRAADPSLPAGKGLADRHVVASARPAAGNDGMIVLGKVTALPAGDVVHRPARFFDLEGRTVTFTPDGEGRYAVQSGSLTWVETSGATGSVFDLSTRYWRGKSAGVSLPFGFPFAGRTWTRVHVNTNGNVSFAAPERTHAEQRDIWSDGRMRSVAAAVDSRSATGFEAMIAVLWALYDEAVVSVDASPERVAITWDAVTSNDYEPAGRNVFQVRLYPSGMIEFAYRQVPERDGIVGLFHGTGPRGAVLSAATDDIGNVRNAAVDVVSAELVDNGSTVIVSATMAADIPERLSSGSLTYRFYLDFGTGSTSHSRPGSKFANCRLELSVGAAGRTAEGCGFVPRAVGYTVQGPTLEIPISKTLWPDNQAVSWRMTANWPDESEFDRIYGEPVYLEESSDRDLSSRTETVAGNVFEVFHYPSTHTNTNYVLPYIYEQVPPDDELAVLFTDFRYDDLFGSGPGSGPLSVPIQGIGDWQANPRSGSAHGSESLLSAAAALYIGGPTYSESGVHDGYEYHGHAPGVRHAAHELVHRWAAHLRFSDPRSGRIEDLTDDWCRCHWSEWLHVPERYPVWAGFSKQPFSSHSAYSVMGGNVWQDNGDGTFTERHMRHPVRGLSDLDLYVMGMIPPEEVRPTFLLRDVVETGTRGIVRATKVPVRIEDIVAAMGPRVPSAREQRKVFRLGVYLLHEDGRSPRAEWLARAQSFAESVSRYFHLATGGTGDPDWGLEMISGDGQQGPAGAALPEPFVVRVRSQAGDPLAGAIVTFFVLAGEAVVWESSAATDSTGRASVTVPLDGEPGTYSIVASVAGLDPVTFAAVGLAVPRTLTKLSGDDQQGAAGTALPEPLVVRVRDQAGGDLAGVQVTFGLRVGEVAVWESSATTDSTGRAAASMTLPRDPGTYTVEATAAGLDPVTFTVVAEVTPDFDADGQVGFSDFFLLAEALGGSDPRFDLDGDGTVGYGDFFLFAEHFTPPARGKLLALARERIGLPDEPGLQANAPNPFNSQTVISWLLLQSGPARVEVFALNGQRVAVLREGPQKAGLHRLRWDGRDDRGRPLASGVYLCRLATEDRVQTRKLTLLR